MKMIRSLFFETKNKSEVLPSATLGKRSNERGQSLVQLVVSIGIMGIIVTIFTQMQSNQLREVRAVREQLAVLDLQRTLTQTFAKNDAGSVCSAIMSGRTFSDPVGAYPKEGALSLNSIPFGGAGGSGSIAAVGQPVGFANSLSVSSIRVDLPAAPAAGIFSARLVVVFDPASSVRRLKNISLPFFLRTSLSGGTYTVADCATRGNVVGRTVLYAKCGWFTDSSGVLSSPSCTPTCPVGWTSLGGIGEVSVSQIPPYEMGYRQRACNTDTSFDILPLQQSFLVAGPLVIGPWAPPAPGCPLGWTALLQNVVPTSMDLGSGAALISGHLERICAKASASL